MAGNINGYAAYRPSVSPHFSQRLSPQQSDAIRQLAEHNAASSHQSVSIPNAVRELSADDPALDFTEKLLKNQLIEEFINSPLSITTEQAYSFDMKAEDVALNYISQHYQKGLSEGKTSNELNKLIDDSAMHYRNAYRNTSSILEKLGKLGPQQKSFISRSEHRVELGLNSLYSAQLGDVFGQPASEPFELTIETQEGDRITITFSINHTKEKGGIEYAAASSEYNSFDSFELSYQVEGDLSDEEHSAMMEIFAGVGQLADDYFSQPQANQDKAILSNDLLANFNSEQLAGIDLSMALSDDHEFSYSYTFDKETEKQSLSSASSARNNVLTTEQSENYTVKAAIEGRQVVALDQEASIANRSEQKSVEAGLTTKESVDTRDSASSSLRLIEGIWTQKLADKSEREDDYGVFDDGKALFSLHKATQDAHQKIVIIGTQNKNDSGEFLRKKYNPQLAKVNLFMGAV